MKTRDPWENSNWDTALAEAVASGDAGGSCGLSLFFEERDDALVLFDDRSDRPLVQSSRIRGLVARGPLPEGRLLYRGDPGLDDAGALARAVVAGHPPQTEPARCHDGESSPEAILPLPAVVELLAGIVKKTRELLPAAAVEARWVGFCQAVRIARAGQPVLRDLRRSGRIRLEVGSEREGTAGAVEEAVLPLDLRGARALLERLPLAVSERFDARRSAQTLSSGERPVVFGPGVGGVLIHELVGHALEADTVLAGRSWLASAAGLVAPAELTVIDDPRRGRAAWRLDDEGEPARPVALLRDGRVTGWLHDLASSRESGQQATGHGRRGSYHEPIRPRMGCTFVAAGRHHPAEVLEGMSDAIYIRRLEAANTDPRSGRAMFRVTDADRIQHGRLAGPLAAHLIAVDAPSALGAIERIADDIAFDRCIGSCLRDGQPLPVSVGGPTFRLALTMARF